MSVPRRVAPLLFVFGAGLAASAPTHAAESYDNCAGTITWLPATITTQGVWCMKGDLSSPLASGAAITVAANNVTIDCNDFKLGGLAAGPATETIGIGIEGRQNTVIRHCNMRGFFIAVKATNGGGHLIEDNRLDGNTRAALYVSAPGSMIRRNTINDTGGSTAIAGISGIGIFAYYGVNIIDNTIAGVMPGPAGSFVAGISATGNGGATLSGNRISGLQLPGAGSTWGIVDDSARSLIVDNMIFGPDTVTGTGIACITPTTIAAKNYIIGFEQPVQGCQESGNIVNPD